MKHIRETSSFLIAIMPVMFIPAAVGLIDSWQDIEMCIRDSGCREHDGLAGLWQFCRDGLDVF